MRYLLFSFLVVFLWNCSAIKQASQSNEATYPSSILQFQKELNAAYKNPNTSPLKPSDLKRFKSLAFFPIDSTYRIKARFERTSDQVPFQMATTSGQSQTYVQFGILHFDWSGQPQQLRLYQNLQFRRMPQYRNTLLLPFTDLTNGTTSYGGGRYIDFKLPQTDTVIVDFNRAYNPYCAYNDGYSCPIPPSENHLAIAIQAGVMAWEK